VPLIAFAASRSTSRGRRDKKKEEEGARWEEGEEEVEVLLGSPSLRCILRASVKEKKRGGRGKGKGEATVHIGAHLLHLPKEGEKERRLERKKKDARGHRRPPSPRSSLAGARPDGSGAGRKKSPQKRRGAPGRGTAILTTYFFYTFSSRGKKEKVRRKGGRSSIRPAPAPGGIPYRLDALVRILAPLDEDEGEREGENDGGKEGGENVLVLHPSHSRRRARSSAEEGKGGEGKKKIRREEKGGGGPRFDSYLFPFLYLLTEKELRGGKKEKGRRERGGIVSCPLFLL